MAERVPLVLLHGWGFDSRIWDEVLPFLREFAQVVPLDLPGFGAASLQDDVLARLPPRCILLGWSLGGMLATQIAIQHPERVTALITVGSNLKWVADRDWPGASADNFAAFFENLTQNLEATKQHFCGVIARGDEKEKQLVKILRAKLSTASQENFLAGLRLLDSIDNRQGFAKLTVPGLHIFGEKDAMVPLAVAEKMQMLNTKQQTMVFADTAHAPFLSEPERFVAAVKAFIKSFSYRLDKKNISASFSKAAPVYDGAAQLQREIGDRLFLLMPESLPHTILDLGCGTGLYGQQWLQRFPQAQVCSLDIASGMLQEARKRWPAIQALCGDAEALPIKNNGMDLVFSNLAIQWCQDHDQLFAELYRVLSPGGMCLLSTFVDGTLQELKDAWQTIDHHVHINRFVTGDALQAKACAQGFSSVLCDYKTVVRHYDSVSDLMRELKTVGAHNINAGRSNGLTGKDTFLRLARAYEKYREAPKLPASYQVAYLTLKK